MFDDEEGTAERTLALSTWSIDPWYVARSVARSFCEHSYFAASAQTLRQLSLQIESVYGLVSSLLS